MGNKQCCGVSAKDEQEMRETKNASMKPTMRDKKKDKKKQKKATRNSSGQKPLPSVIDSTYDHQNHGHNQSHKQQGQQQSDVIIDRDTIKIEHQLSEVYQDDQQWNRQTMQTIVQESGNPFSPLPTQGCSPDDNANNVIFEMPSAQEESILDTSGASPNKNKTKKFKKQQKLEHQQRKVDNFNENIACLYEFNTRSGSEKKPTQIFESAKDDYQRNQNSNQSQNERLNKLITRTNDDQSSASNLISQRYLESFGVHSGLPTPNQTVIYNESVKPENVCLQDQLNRRRVTLPAAQTAEAQNIVDIVVEELTNESIISPPDQNHKQSSKHGQEHEKTDIILPAHHIGAFITDNSQNQNTDGATHQLMFDDISNKQVYKTDPVQKHQLSNQNQVDQLKSDKQNSQSLRSFLEDDNIEENTQTKFSQENDNDVADNSNFDSQKQTVISSPICNDSTNKKPNYNNKKINKLDFPLNTPQQNKSNSLADHLSHKENRFSSTISPSKLENIDEDFNKQISSGTADNRYSLVSFGAIPNNQGFQNDQDRQSLGLHPQRLSFTSFGQLGGLKRDSIKDDDFVPDPPFFEFELQDANIDKQSESSGLIQSFKEGSKHKPNIHIKQASFEESESFETALRESQHSESAKTHDIKGSPNLLYQIYSHTKSVDPVQQNGFDAQSIASSNQNKRTKNLSYGSNQDLRKNTKCIPVQLAVAFDNINDEQSNEDVPKPPPFRKGQLDQDQFNFGPTQIPTLNGNSIQKLNSVTKQIDGDSKKMNVKSLYEMLQKQKTELVDSDQDEDELRIIAESAYKKPNSELRRKFYREFVKKINSFGGIRSLHAKFKKERRALINLNNQSKAMSDVYFKLFWEMVKQRCIMNLSKTCS